MNCTICTETQTNFIKCGGCDNGVCIECFSKIIYCPFCRQLVNLLKLEQEGNGEDSDDNYEEVIRHIPPRPRRQNNNQRRTYTVEQTMRFIERNLNTPRGRERLNRMQREGRL